MGPKILSATTFVFAIVIALAAVLQTAEAETHKVSWSNTLAADYYTSWAANYTFKVGDVLVFNFTTGRHDVAELTKDAYEKCNVTGFIGTPKSEGPANYTLSATGDHYFICLFPEHCDQGGQKLTIAVAAGDCGSAPTPAPAPSNTSTPPSKSESPPPSGDESPPPTYNITTAEHVKHYSTTARGLDRQLFLCHHHSDCFHVHFHSSFLLLLDYISSRTCTLFFGSVWIILAQESLVYITDARWIDRYI